MSELDATLTLNWIETHNGYRHGSGMWSILWWNSNRDTVALYRAVDGEWLWILDGKLHDAIARVEISTQGRI